MSVSIELKVVKQCTSELEGAGLERDRALIHFLNGEGFMLDSEQEDILDPRPLLREDQKAGEIVKWIKHRVKQDPCSYYKLVSHLSACEKFYQPIVKKLEDCRKTLLSNARSTLQQDTGTKATRTRGVSEDSAFASVSSLQSSEFGSPTRKGPLSSVFQQAILSKGNENLSCDVQTINTGELEQTFSDITYHTLGIINEQGITPYDFKRRLISLPVKNKSLHKEFLEQLWPQIRISSATVDDIWFELEMYWDFLNYTLLEHLVNKFGDDALKANMQEYKESLKKFRCKTRLCDFARHFKDQVNRYLVGQELMKLLEVKFAKNWDECTLEDLENWKESITQKLLLPSFVLILTDTDSGCVSVTWAIPAIFAASVMEDMKTMKMMEFCVEHSILLLRIDGKEWVSTEGSQISTVQEAKADALVQEPSFSDACLISGSFPDEQAVPSVESPVKVECGCDGEACTIPAVVKYIKDVKNVRALGLFLKIEPGRLDEIEQSGSGDSLIGIVQEWLKFMSDDWNGTDPWKELQRVLLEPAVDEPAIAQKLPVDSAISGFPDRSSFSSSVISPYQMSYVERIGRKTEECSIANVLNCIAPYSEVHAWYQIGECLKLPEKKLDKIRAYPLPDQMAHMVELWHRSDCFISWEKLKQALTLFLGRRGLSHTQHHGSSIRKPKYAVPFSAVQEKDFHIARGKIDTLHEKFRSLVEDLRNQLDSQRIEVTDVRDTLLSLPRDLHVIYSPILEEMFRSLGRCESYGMRELFCKLGDCWNFIDIDLLESIIDEHGNTELRSAMEAYTKQLKMFCQSTTVHQLIEIWRPKFPKSSVLDIPQGSHKHCKSLVTRLDRDARTYTIQELDCLRREALNVMHHPLSFTTMIHYAKCDKMTALLWACENGHVDMVDYLLKHEADTSAKCEGMTSLMWAAAKGHASVVCSLLETEDRGGINYQTEDNGWSALFFAYEGRHDGVVKLLLEYGADTHLKDKEKKVAADYGVVKKPSIKFKDFVVEKGLSLMKKTFSILRKKLLSLAEIGDYDGIKKLLEEGNMDVDVRDPSRKDWTSLMWACNEGHYEIVKLLLKHRANIHLSSTTGWTPLHIACSNNFVRIAYFLLRSGANPNRPIDVTLNYTPLMYISDMDDMEPMARALLKHGANLEIAAAENGWTPLIEACHSGKEELVKLYLDHGAEVNKRAARGWTALMSAARKNWGNIVRLLIEKGASMEMTMTDANKVTGESAIHIASYTGSTSVIPVLVENGANPNVTNEADLSPLMIATNRNNIEIVEALFQSDDIDVDLQQKRTGLTALFLAAKNGHVEIFQKLLKCGASDEIYIGGERVNVHDIVRVFKKSKDIIKALERHKMEVEQRRPKLEKRFDVQKERSEVEQLQDVQLPAEKPTKEHTAVPKEDVVEPPGSLMPSLERPIVVAEESTGELPLSQNTMVKKESETEEEPVALALSEAAGGAVTPALELSNSEPSNLEKSDELSRLDEAPQDDKEQLSLSQSEAKDSSSETSSLYAAEEVCGTSQKQDETSKDQGRGTKVALSQAEKEKILDHLIRNCFDAHAASWKHTQNLNEDQQEYSGKGLRSLDAYHNFTNIYS